LLFIRYLGEEKEEEKGEEEKEKKIRGGESFGMSNGK